MFLNDFQEIMVEYGFAYVIPDPNRPGPDYYKDCNEFNWASSLIKSHQKHIQENGKEDVYKIEYTPEELALIQKLKASSSYLNISIAAVGLACISMI